MIVGKKRLTFKVFELTNSLRCKESFHPIKDWTPEWYFLSMVSEFGEMGNFLKKIHRLDSKNNAHLSKKQRENKRKKLLKEVGKEIADVQAYLSLLALSLDIKLEDVLVDKFNEVSDRVGSKYKL